MILKGIGYLFMGASFLAFICILGVDLKGAFILAGLGFVLFFAGLFIYDKGENIKLKEEEKRKKRRRGK